MTEYRDIIIRLKKLQSIRAIQRETGIHRTIIRKIKKVAEKKGWLSPFNSVLPTEKELQQIFIIKENQNTHPLKCWYNEIERWINEGYSYVVIHRLINQNYSCSEATVRRYIKKHFPVKPKTVMVRDLICGEIMEVDFGYLGITYDPFTKKNRKTYVFSARLRYSRKAFRIKVFGQHQDTFFKCHILAFEYFGGVPEKVVPDNLKAAVIQASFECPLVNRVYQKLAEHYGFLISPCLPRKANHKGGVENDIKYIKNNFWPVFKEEQRNKGRIIPDSAELDHALEEWTKNVTDVRKIQNVGISPNQLFIEEQKALKPLPKYRWDQITWAEAKVQENWRIQFQSAFYSIPYKYVGNKVQIMADSTHVHIFYDYVEIATHQKAKAKWQYMRKSEHAPPEPEKYMSTTKKGLLMKAKNIGTYTEKAAEAILTQKTIDGLRPVRALLFSMTKKYSNSRVEAACKRAIHYQTVSYMSIKSILIKGLDLLDLEDPVMPSGQRQFTFAREYGYFDPDNQ